MKLFLALCLLLISTQSLALLNKQATVLSAGDMSTATLTSAVFDIRAMVDISCQAVYTGAPVGTLKLQGSDDNSTYSDVGSSSVSIAAAGDALYDMSAVSYGYLRAVYTKTSGTGAITIKCFAKDRR